MGIRTRLGRIVGAAIAVTALVGVLASPAGADPKKADVIEVHCDMLGTLLVATPGQGPLGPGLVQGSTQVGIPYKIHVEGTFTPVVGPEESFVEDAEHPAPRNGRLDHCTFHEEGSDEFGSFVVDGEVWISYTPSH